MPPSTSTQPAPTYVLPTPKSWGWYEKGEPPKAEDWNGTVQYVNSEGRAIRMIILWKSVAINSLGPNIEKMKLGIHLSYAKAIT